MEKKELLLDLLKIDSESGKEKEIGEFIVERLSQNFNVEKQKVNDNFNILAYVGNPKVLFVAHMDTVPGQIEIQEKEGYIFGRGACDNKSQLAAMILAAEKALDKGLKDFGVLFTVEEETNFSGIKKALEKIPETVELIVLGEPTNLDIVNGHKGLINIKLSCQGKSCHGAMPEKGINAIELLIEQLKKIKEIEFEESNILGKNVINISNIKGGDASNVVPNYAEAFVVIRNVSESEKIINKLKEKITCNIEFGEAYDPVINLEADKIASKLNIKTRVAPYFTEAYFLNKKSNIIILGAGLEEDSHSNEEKIKIDDFEKLIELYLKILE